MDRLVRRPHHRHDAATRGARLHADSRLLGATVISSREAKGGDIARVNMRDHKTATACSS